MDITEVDVIATIGWKNEDELPDWIDDEAYNILFDSSRIIYGVRMFPYISLCGKDIYLLETERLNIPKDAG